MEKIYSEWVHAGKHLTTIGSSLFQNERIINHNEVDKWNSEISKAIDKLIEIKEEMDSFLRLRKVWITK